MTRDDDWWLELVYNDPTPARELRGCHMNKLHLAVTRHLITKHAESFDRQVGLHVVTAMHNGHHDGPWGAAPHPHEALGVPHRVPRAE
jgi:hypothetical protein